MSKKGNIRCFNCGILGHFARRYSALNKKYPNENGWEYEKGPEQRLAVIKTPHVLENETCTQRSWTTSKCGINHMIIDSGASVHAVACIGLVHSITEVDKVEVELAD